MPIVTRCRGTRAHPRQGAGTTLCYFADINIRTATLRDPLHKAHPSSCFLDAQARAITAESPLRDAVLGQTYRTVYRQLAADGVLDERALVQLYIMVERRGGVAAGLFMNPAV